MVQTTRMSTSTGAPIVYLDPSQTPVRAADLSVHLSRVCRYAGGRDWSVLQHLVICADIARGGLPLTKEMLPYVAAHDLHEAYIGDLPTGLKQVLPEWRERIEGPWEAHVHRSIGLEWPVPPEIAVQVKRVDRQALLAEMACLSHPLLDVALEGTDGVSDMDVFFARVLRNSDLDAGGLWAIVRRALGEAVTFADEREGAAVGGAT